MCLLIISVSKNVYHTWIYFVFLVFVLFLIGVWFILDGTWFSTASWNVFSIFSCSAKCTSHYTASFCPVSSGKVGIMKSEELHFGGYVNKSYYILFWMKILIDNFEFRCDACDNVLNHSYLYIIVYFLNYSLFIFIFQASFRTCKILLYTIGNNKYSCIKK